MNSREFAMFGLKMGFSLLAGTLLLCFFLLFKFIEFDVDFGLDYIILLLALSVYFWEGLMMGLRWRTKDILSLCMESENCIAGLYYIHHLCAISGAKLKEYLM